MSIAGALRLFRVSPKHPVGQGHLAVHLRELRARLMIVAVTIVLGIVVAWFFYDLTFQLLKETGPLIDGSQRSESTAEVLRFGSRTQPWRWCGTWRWVCRSGSLSLSPRA